MALWVGRSQSIFYNYIIHRCVASLYICVYANQVSIRRTMQYKCIGWNGGCVHVSALIRIRIYLLKKKRREEKKKQYIYREEEV